MGKSKRQSWRRIDLTELEDRIDAKPVIDRVNEATGNNPELLFKLDIPGKNLESSDGKYEAVEAAYVAASAGTAKKSSSFQSTLAHTKQVEKAKRQIAKVGNLKALKSSEISNKRKKVTKKFLNSAFDLWESGNLDSVPSSLLTSPATRELIVTKALPKGLLPALQKNYTLKTPRKILSVPAVKVALPGQSYNPAPADYETAVSMLGKELQEREDKLLPRNPAFFAYSADAKEEEEEEEAEKEDADELEENEEAIDNLVLAEKEKRRLKAAAENRKNRTQRNKEARKKLMLSEAKKKKQSKEFYKSADKVDQFMEDIRIDEQLIKQKRDEKIMIDKAAMKAEMAGEVKSFRLAKHKFEEKPIELNLPSSLSSSLRKLQAVHAAASDYMQSVYRRGMLEPPPSMEGFNSKMRQRMSRERDRRLNMAKKVVGKKRFQV